MVQLSSTTRPGQMQQTACAYATSAIVPGEIAMVKRLLGALRTVLTDGLCFIIEDRYTMGYSVINNN